RMLPLPRIVVPAPSVRDSPRRRGQPTRLLLASLSSEEYPVKTAPLALVTLGAYLKSAYSREELDIAYFDFQQETPEEFFATVNHWHPSAIGLSAKIGSSELLMDVIAGLASDSPTTHIIIGNTLGTYGFREILERYKHVVCAIGRGEVTLREYVAWVKGASETSDLLRVPGVSFLNGSVLYETGGEAVDLAELGEADWQCLFRRYPPHTYQEIWLEASRGCPQKRGGVGCSFCAILPSAG